MAYNVGPIILTAHPGPSATHKSDNCELIVNHYARLISNIKRQVGRKLLASYSRKDKIKIKSCFSLVEVHSLLVLETHHEKRIQDYDVTSSLGEVTISGFSMVTLQETAKRDKEIISSLSWWWHPTYLHPSVRWHHKQLLDNYIGANKGNDGLLPLRGMMGVGN